MPRRTPQPPQFHAVNPYAAGIDIGAEAHYVAVPEQCATPSVRRFATFTEDLYQLADWLHQCRIETVVMESTGVYWIPLFEILEARGFEVLLVDARRVKNVSGRKSDVLDCQWLQQFHTYGLLQGAFRPADQIVVLRSYLRQRAMLIQYAAAHVQHMQKALQQMNLLLYNVVSDIVGVTGLKIIRAILTGERNPQVLAQHRDYRCKHSEAEIAKSLVGNYREEHLFALQQALTLYESYQAQTAACDARIEAYLQRCRRSWMTHHHRAPKPANRGSIASRLTCGPTCTSSRARTSRAFMGLMSPQRSRSFPKSG